MAVPAKDRVLKSSGHGESVFSLQMSWMIVSGCDFFCVHGHIVANNNQL